MSTQPRAEFLSQITGMRAIMLGAAFAEPSRDDPLHNWETTRGQELAISGAAVDRRFVSDLTYRAYARERRDLYEVVNAMKRGGR